MSQPEQIYFFDTTLRDGEQSPGCTMHHDEKLRMAHQLQHLGVDVIEAGFAIASEGDAESIRRIATEVKGPRICSLSRATNADLEAAARALEPAEKNRIHIFLATSDLHLSAKLNITREQCLERAHNSISYGATLVDEIEFSAEDATRTDPDFLVEVITVAVKAGAKVINIPDTVGYTIPTEYANTFKMLRERVPGIENVLLSTHCHDDLGLAVANSLAGLAAGARQVECTINGIGERAGNAALEEVAAALMVREDKFPFTSNVKNEELFPTSQLLSQIISFGCAPNKAVVGANAFAHESGIHQHGILANPLTYEIMTPASVGVTATNIVLGKHSGRRALAHRLESLGFYHLTKEQLDAVYQRFISMADRKKGVYDQDLLALLREETSITTAL